MAEDSQEAKRQADEARKAEKDAKELAEKREHELKVAKLSAGTTPKATIFAALITAVATILAALIAVLFKADSAGAKINNYVGGSTSTLNNIEVGLRAFTNLANPSVPLQAAIPGSARQIPDTSSSSQTTARPAPAPASQVTQGSPIVDNISTDPTVLDSCFGITPLKPQRILVEAVANGYNISMRVQNAGKGAVSVWAEGLRQLNDNVKNEFTSGGTNLPGPSFHTFDKPLENAFNGGEAIQPGDSGALTFEFSHQALLNAGSAITLHANLDYIIKDEAGQFTFQHANLSCQNLPVMSTVKR